jgi:HAE1 family hydrophobic/amphiphilic exporter-1
MTSLTTIFGLLPMVLVRGEGNEMLSSLSAPLLGGLTTSTFLTLFVVPVLYASVADLRERSESRRAARAVKEG